MKRIYTVLTVLILRLSLCACSAEPKDDSAYTVKRDGIVFTVDPLNKTITDGTHTYQYDLSGGVIRITYPDGSSYWWKTQDCGGFGGWSPDYDEDRYVPGDTLCLRCIELCPP